MTDTKATKKTAKKASKKKATKKAPTKKVASKKAASKKTASKKTGKEVAKKDVKQEVKTILEGVSLSASRYDESVDLLVKKLKSCHDIINDSGAVMAITNELTDLLPVGDVSGLDLIYDAMGKFKVNHSVMKNQVKELENEVKETPEYKVLEEKRKQLAIMGNYGQVFGNYLDITSKYFYDRFENDIDTPLGRNFKHTSRASLKVSDIEKVPNEYKMGVIKFSSIEEYEKCKDFLLDNGIDFECELTQTSGQKKSLKEKLEGFVKSWRDFFSATEEQRKEEGLTEVDIDKVFEEYGAVAKYDAKPLGEFKNNMF